MLRRVRFFAADAALVPVLTGVELPLAAIAVLMVSICRLRIAGRGRGRRRTGRRRRAWAGRRRRRGGLYIEIGRIRLLRAACAGESAVYPAVVKRRGDIAQHYFSIGLAVGQPRIGRSKLLHRVLFPVCVDERPRALVHTGSRCNERGQLALLDILARWVLCYRRRPDIGRIYPREYHIAPAVADLAVYRGVVEIGLQPIRKVAPGIRVKADLHRGIIRGEGIYRLPGHIIPAYARQIAAGSARCGSDLRRAHHCNGRLRRRRKHLGDRIIPL